MLVPTPLGDARITRFPAAARCRAVLMLGHGAGGGVEAPDLRALVVQGAVDPFGTPAEYPPLPLGHRLVALSAGGHEFAVRKAQTPVFGEITDAVAEWIDALLG